MGSGNDRMVAVIALLLLYGCRYVGSRSPITIARGDTK